MKTEQKNKIARALFIYGLVAFIINTISFFWGESSIPLSVSVIVAFVVSFSLVEPTKKNSYVHKPTRDETKDLPLWEMQFNSEFGSEETRSIMFRKQGIKWYLEQFALSHQPNKMPSEGDWISVDDRFPVQGELVLVYYGFGSKNDKRVHCAYTDGELWFDPYNKSRLYNEHLSHWRELPEPPKQ